MCSDNLFPPTTTTTITVLGPDGFAAGKKEEEEEEITPEGQFHVMREVNNSQVRNLLKINLEPGCFFLQLVKLQGCKWRVESDA